jgi:hypothetical protein
MGDLVSDPARIRRVCRLDDNCAPPHGWEVLNPETAAPYRRGRVVFLCRRRGITCVRCYRRVRDACDVEVESRLCLPCLFGPLITTAPA